MATVSLVTTGTNCTKRSTRERRSLSEASWKDYVDILNHVKTSTMSRYWVVKGALT